MKTIAMILLMGILVTEWVVSIEKNNVGRTILNFSKIMLLIEIFKNLLETP